jgi:predicted nucleotidyltransferase
MRAYRRALEAALPGRILRIVVFGSVARGEANEDSDVDVLVLVDRLSFAERGNIIDIGSAIGFDRGLLIRPVALQRDEWDRLGRRERLFAREVERDGIEA